MKLQELLKDVAVKNSTAAQAIEIKEVRYDSRAVQPGDLFVAIRGYATDGHKYIAKAMEQGAAAVVCEEAPKGVPAVVVENSRIALAEIAANRFGHPAESMVMLGVTGTNGKTTTTYLVKHMLEDAGHKVGLIGTNQNLIGDEVIETERTTPESSELHADGVEFTAQYQGEKADVKLPIPGHFSVENALTALGIVLQLGMPLADAAKSMATATGVKGRVEVVPTDTDYTVLIDYAHSPDGMENVLKAVRGFAKGRVVALFGCGGDRDRTKRPKMGRIAADLADFCVVTSDNPRTEEPKAIIDDILEGMKDSDTPMQVIVDRPEAIHWALAHAQKDDIIVLMGKGHETYQEVNHVKHHMDEREIVADYFKK